MSEETENYFLIIQEITGSNSMEVRKANRRSETLTEDIEDNRPRNIVWFERKHIKASAIK